LTILLNHEKREAETYLLIGLRYFQDEDNRRAINFFSSAIDIDPYFSEAFGFRGIARFSHQPDLNNCPDKLPPNCLLTKFFLSI